MRENGASLVAIATRMLERRGMTYAAARFRRATIS